MIHFYHVWADGSWERPISEHFGLLRTVGFTGEVRLGMVGTPENRGRLLKSIEFDVSVCSEAEEGYEQLTLKAVREYAQDYPGDKVYYSHAKGSYTDHPINHNWRNSMDLLLLRQYQDHLEDLDHYDAIGCHWLTPDLYYWRGVSTPFFGGNFWWAATDYLATLPDPAEDSRYSAEQWIGIGNPRIKDLKPGWPAY